MNGIQTYAVLGKSHSFSSRKEISGVVRVSDFTQSLVLQPDEKNNTKGMSKDLDFRCMIVLFAVIERFHSLLSINTVNPDHEMPRVSNFVKSDSPRW